MAEEKVTKTAAKKKPAAKKAAGSVTIKLTRSLIGRSEKQIATAKSLGLKRVGDTTVQPDNAATAGKINTISHMVEFVKA
ncbi:MAG TPA: 50S ribosomal protein L30 [Candidatus Ruthenibacterium merdigallinarum]|nr:50S ribosomal protein L30 [Candidatus Ruthenibacterium merdigallinarum]